MSNADRPSRTLVLCFDGTGDLYDSTVGTVFYSFRGIVVNYDLLEHQRCQVILSPQER